MGVKFVDFYSLLHLASGIIAYYFYIPLWLWIILHGLFEVFENQPETIYLRKENKWMIPWPGGKINPDSLLNILGDEFFAILGWVIAYFWYKISMKYFY
jgi:hypothetical protein